MEQVQVFHKMRCLYTLNVPDGYWQRETCSGVLWFYFVHIPLSEAVAKTKNFLASIPCEII